MAAPDTADQQIRDKIAYAFGHLVASYDTDAHAGDSGDLGDEVMREVVPAGSMWIIDAIAEHVAGNYAYTGEAIDIRRKIQNEEF